MYAPEITQELIDKATAFHGHWCGGLARGIRVASWAMEHFGTAADEEIVAVTETDLCAVDAIQALVGCTFGKGNLIFHLTGKQAYTVFNRKTRESIRIVLKNRPEGLSREESFAYYQSKEPSEIFDVTPVKITLPESAKLYESFVCSCCGETAGSNWIRFVDGKPLCLDCFAEQEEKN